MFLGIFSPSYFSYVFVTVIKIFGFKPTCERLTDIIILRLEQIVFLKEKWQNPHQMSFSVNIRLA
jgi:hypothetical protein